MLSGSSLIDFQTYSIAKYLSRAASSQPLLRQPENYLRMLLAAGILSPNTSKVKPPTVTNQPRMKYRNGSVPHDWVKLSCPLDTHLWYADESTSIDFRTITFEIATTAIPANTSA
jgi:hypothetical protein